MKRQDGDAHEDYVAKVRHSTNQFVEETLRENGRLRSNVLKLENDQREAQELVTALRGQLAKQDATQALACEQVQRVENENRRIFAEYAAIEQQNSNLANLYVASYRLQGTLDRAEVLQVIQEVIINLVGSEELAVFELDSSRQQLMLLSAFGVDEAKYASLPLDDSAIATTARTGEMFLQEPPPSNLSAPESSLTTCIPLKVNNRVIGVIAVFRMLPQKPTLASVDRDLFGLLGTHAGLALYCSGLAERAGRAEEKP
jgi:GAF domain